jgi:hypothetical protein
MPGGFGRSFGLDETPVLVTRALRKSEIEHAATTEGASHASPR